MIGAIALVDLDDTLFQTLRKCPPELNEEQLTPLAFARDGEPLGFATPRQLRFLSWLSETAHVVPVTGRSLDALRRTQLPYAAAICAYGGLILDEAGSIDAMWQRRIAEAARPHAATLTLIAHEVSAAATASREPIDARVLNESDIPLYVVAKHADADVAALNRVVAAASVRLPAGWTEHRNGNNVAWLPPFLGKAHAVAHILPGLRVRFPNVPVIGIGDSSTDAAFMRLCDFAMFPTGSQLAERVFNAG